MPEPNVGQGLLGAAGGLLSTGNPLGAIFGGIGGLFGGDDQQTTNYNYTPLSGAQQNITNLGNEQMQSIIARLGPDAQNALISQLSEQFSGVLKQQTSDAFNIQEGRARANMGRTGGGPSSVMNRQMAQLGTEEAKAMNQAQMQGDLMGHQIGGQQFGQNLAAFQGIGGFINQAEGTRRVSSTDSTAPGTALGSLMGGIGASLTDPNSHFAQNSGGLGWFGAPLYGSPVKSVDAGNQQGSQSYPVPGANNQGRRMR